jgi:hypothetical protein
MCIEGEWCFGYMKAVSVLSGENEPFIQYIMMIKDILSIIQLSVKLETNVE